MLFTVSPAFLYFSRFIRHDIYVDFFTLLLVIGVFRYLATGQRNWFYTACVAAALLFATKEDFFISGFIPFVFLVGSWFLLQGRAPPAVPQPRARARRAPVGDRRWASFVAINLLLYTTFLTNLQGICTAVVTLPLNALRGLDRRAELLAAAAGLRPRRPALVLLLHAAAAVRVRAADPRPAGDRPGPAHGSCSSGSAPSGSSPRC